MTLDELVVELRLDPANFTKGQKEALEAFKKTDDEMQRRLKNIESTNKSAARSVEGITHAAQGLVTALVGAGMASFARDTMTTVAATGRMATNIGVATQELSAFGRMIERNGGNADAAVGSMKGFSDQITRLKTLGQGSDDLFRFLGTIGSQEGDSPLDAFMKFAEWAEKNKDNPQLVNQVGQWGGFDQGMINTALKGRTAVVKEYAAAMKVAIGPEQVAAMTRMQSSWISLDQAISKTGTAVVTNYEPAITAVTGGLASWIERNEKLASTLGTVAAALAALAALKPAAWVLRLLGLGRVAGALGGAAALPGKIIKGGGVGGLALSAAVAMKQDSQSGNKLRTWLRAKLGIEDPGEAAPWAGSKPNEKKTTTADDPAGPRHVTGTNFAPAAEREAFYRAEAKRRGISPDQAMRVTEREGFRKYVGDRGSSFGDWQLHYGKVASGGMAVGGLGDEFTKKTGLDARDPATWKEQATFVLDYAKSHGWGAWHGWKGDKMAGIGGGSATEIKIGDINVTTDSKNPREHGRLVADEIKTRLKEASSLATQANTGLN